MVKCDYKNCKKKAVYNLQTEFVLYRISYDKEGLSTYKKIKDWEGDTNEHYCEKHAEIEGII